MSHRVSDPPTSGFENDDAAREYGRQLAMDLLLHELHRPVLTQPRSARFAWLINLSAAAAVVSPVNLFHFPQAMRPPTTHWAARKMLRT